MPTTRRRGPTPKPWKSESGWPRPIRSAMSRMWRLTQNNLGIMYRNLNAYDKAEGAYAEALEIYKRLAQTNPERYEPDVAMTQNNLGLMYADLNAYDKAEGAYAEALEIR
jgi:tetratricopeptide (TPR) repeat protein